MSNDGSNKGKFQSGTPTGSGFGGAGTPGSGSNYPTSPTSYPSSFPLLIPDPSLKGVPFDQLLQNRGIRFTHRLATPCPNMNAVADNNHDPQCPHCDGNGIMYYREKEIWGVFQSNSLQKNFEMQGLWEIGTAVITLPTYYPDGTAAEFNTFDQLVLEDTSVRLWELKDYETRSDNSHQMRYPIEKVDFCGAVKDDQKVEFIEGTDFNIVNGNMEWVAGKEPDYDPITQLGEVLSIAYFAKPVYNVLQHMREIRMSQELVGGVKQPVRLPQQILVKRDFLANPPETDAQVST